jgi:hypothetical protein
MAEKGRVFTGARARFLLNGKKVGYATNVSGSEEITYEPIEVLDNLQVEEYAPTGYRVSFTASMVRIVGESVKSAGWFPKLGTSPEEHLKNVLLSGDLAATIEDNKTKKILLTVEQVKLASHNFTINARGIVGQDMTFVAIRMRDEADS